METYFTREDSLACVSLVESMVAELVLVLLSSLSCREEAELVASSSAPELPDGSCACFTAADGSWSPANARGHE